MKEGQPSRQTKLERPPLHLIIHLSVTVIGKWCALWLNASARLFLYTYCPCLPTFSSRFLSSILPDRSCVCGLHACLCWLVHVCARVRLFRFTAGDRSWIEMGEQKKKKTPQPISLHHRWQLLLFHITRRATATSVSFWSPQISARVITFASVGDDETWRLAVEIEMFAGVN